MVQKRMTPSKTQIWGSTIDRKIAQLELFGAVIGSVGLSLGFMILSRVVLTQAAVSSSGLWVVPAIFGGQGLILLGLYLMLRRVQTARNRLFQVWYCLDRCLEEMQKNARLMCIIFVAVWIGAQVVVLVWTGPQLLSLGEPEVLVVGAWVVFASITLIPIFLFLRNDRRARADAQQRHQVMSDDHYLRRDFTGELLVWSPPPAPVRHGLPKARQVARSRTRQRVGR